MRFFILLSLACAVVALPKAPKNVITAGEPTQIQRFPFIGSMQLSFNDNNWSNFCAGSLLTSQTMLSSANCYFGFNTLEKYWRVRLGSDMWNSGGSLHYISNFILHEDFDTYTMENNVAIVRLTASAVFSDKIGVARIVGPTYPLPDGISTQVVGWVQQIYGDPLTQVPDQLHQADVSVINKEFCAQRWLELSTTPGYTYFANVTNSMVCTGSFDNGEVKNSCVGNEGGPILQQSDVIVAVYSWDYDCGYSNYPGVSARVSDVSDWIVAQGSTRSAKISVV